MTNRVNPDVLAELLASLRAWWRERERAERDNIRLRYQRIRALADSAYERKAKHEQNRINAEGRHRIAHWQKHGIEWRQMNPCWREDRPVWQNMGLPIWVPYKDGRRLSTNELPPVPPLDYPAFRYTRAELLAIREAALLRLRIDYGMSAEEAAQDFAEQRSWQRKARRPYTGRSLAQIGLHYDTEIYGPTCRPQFRVVRRCEAYDRDQITALTPLGQASVVFRDDCDH